MTERKKKKSLPGLLALICAVTLAGCAQDTAVETGETAETVELMEPVGTSSAWDEVSRRDMYSAKVYSGAVLPYVEEYELSEAQTFLRYGAYPGEEIKKGGALLYSDTQELDKQIEALEKSIDDMDLSYEEYMADVEESLKKPRENVKIYGDAIERLESSKPEEYIVTVDEDGQEVKTENPEYAEWKQSYDYCDPRYRDAWLTVARLEQGQKERTELYELDRGYSVSRLEKLRQKKREGTLYSGMAGTVAAMRYFGVNTGSWSGRDYNVPRNAPLMAVADVERKRVCCQYINEPTVRGAADVYAFINGRRYEVTYEPMDETEVRNLIKNQIDVYSTFWIEDDGEVEQGDYAVIVVVSEKREEALSIPRTALHRDGNGSYVYVREGTESVYTPVKTGLYEGMYVEILSGLEEGDQVLTTQGTQPGENILTLAKGEVHSEFKAEGDLYYTSVTTVENPVKYGTCYCEEMPLRFQQVEKGEVIARIRVEPDENAIARYEKQLQRAKERLEDLKEQDETANEKIIEQRQEEIEELEETLDEIRADARVTEIKAPVSGIITDLGSYEKDDRIDSQAMICIIADPQRCFIRVTDENKLLNFGNEATVNYQNKQGVYTEGTGRVVTVNSMGLSYGLRTYRALIMLPQEMVEDMSVSTLGLGDYWNNAIFSVKVTTRKMENVVLVPKSAVIESNGSTYVNVRMPDGRIMTKSFIAGGSDGKNYWVLEGLTEGMEICSE